MLKISILDTESARVDAGTQPRRVVSSRAEEHVEGGSGESPSSRTRDRLTQPIQMPWRMNMHDKPIEPMCAENVEEFDVWIFDSRDLAVSVIPHHAPLSVITENYEIQH